tara:strand:+ start:403 stop:579 length:177 start_codon:yes stop_codon:yes gene_type:complete
MSSPKNIPLQKVPSFSWLDSSNSPTDDDLKNIPDYIKDMKPWRIPDFKWSSSPSNFTK